MLDHVYRAVAWQCLDQILYILYTSSHKICNWRLTWRTEGFGLCWNATQMCCHLVMCLAYLVNVLSRHCQFLGTVDTTYKYISTHELESLFDTTTRSLSVQWTQTAIPHTTTHTVPFPPVAPWLNDSHFSCSSAYGAVLPPLTFMSLKLGDFALNLWKVPISWLRSE
jgi:hypothetical protein